MVKLDQPELETPAGLARWQQNGVCQMDYGWRRAGDMDFRLVYCNWLQARLMVGTHMKEGCRRRVGAILTRLRTYDLWPDMDTAAQEFVRECLHYADSRSGAVISRSPATLQHGAVVGEVLYFENLHLGGAEGDELFPAKERYECLLVLVEM